MSRGARASSGNTEHDVAEYGGVRSYSALAVVDAWATCQMVVALLAEEPVVSLSHVDGIEAETSVAR